MELNKNKINELVKKFNKMNLTYLDISSFDTIETELTNTETEFNLYCDLFNELVKPVLQNVRNQFGKDVRDEIIFNYFAFENGKFYLAFYEPIVYIDLNDYLNDTENTIEKLVKEFL
ncbi:hypothetical protein PCV68_000988 [Staphylococcus pseudintermedius]|nr:hypothetical protein [Staphylococcus pseudintermedius]